MINRYKNPQIGTDREGEISLPPDQTLKFSELNGYTLESLQEVYQTTRRKIERDLDRRIGKLPPVPRQIIGRYPLKELTDDALIELFPRVIQFEQSEKEKEQKQEAERKRQEQELERQRQEQERQHQELARAKLEKFKQRLTMRKTPQYYRKAFNELGDRIAKVSRSFSPLAQHISYLVQEEIIREDFNNYITENEDDFQKLPLEVTVKNLIELIIKDSAFTQAELAEVDQFVFLGMVVDQVETFAKMFLDLGFAKQISQNDKVRGKWDVEVEKAVQEIFDRESLIMVVSYLEAMRKQICFDRNAKDWEYPSLKPYCIKSMFFGKKLGDVVAKYGT